MDWIFQTNGIINQCNEKTHIGTQPTRVLNLMNVYAFQNTHPNFANELSETIKQNGISKQLFIYYGENKIIHTPFIRNDNKSIYLDETFLSYLWCICYSIYTIYIQTIDYQRCNEIARKSVYKIDDEITLKAYELFGYARMLIVHFEKWDIDYLPNPEKYSAEKKDFIEQSNCFYTEAMKFILCHEYIHAIKHIDVINKNSYENSHYVEFEK